jgi:hypothetical protein
MTSAKARAAHRTIRAAVPNDLYARLAFLAAQAGVTIPHFVQGVVAAKVAELKFLPGDDHVADDIKKPVDRASTDHENKDAVTLDNL